jgi:small basic protein
MIANTKVSPTQSPVTSLAIVLLLHAVSGSCGACKRSKGAPCLLVSHFFAAVTMAIGVVVAVLALLFRDGAVEVGLLRKRRPRT